MQICSLLELLTTVDVKKAKNLHDVEFLLAVRLLYAIQAAHLTMIVYIDLGEYCRN